MNNNELNQNKKPNLDDSSNQLVKPQDQPLSAGDDGKEKHFGGKNTDFDAKARKQNEPVPTNNQAPSFNMSNLKDLPNKGKETLKNAVDNQKEKLNDKFKNNKSKIEKPDNNNDSYNPLNNIRSKMPNAFNNLMNRNNDNNQNDNPDESNKEDYDKSGTEMMNDGLKNIANKASSFVGNKLGGSGKDIPAATNLLFKGKISIAVKVISILVIVLLFFGLLLVGGVFTTTTGEASAVSDIFDAEYYFGEDFEDFSQIENKHLRKILENLKEIKEDFTKDGKSFDHVMTMATINALMEYDKEGKITYKSFSKSDLKEIVELVSGKSDDEIMSGIDTVLVPKYLKNIKVPTNTEETSTEEQTSTTTAATTSKGYTIENRNGVYYINNIMIVNKTYNISSSYNPGGLTSEFMTAYNKLTAAAKKENIEYERHSGFRSYEDQVATYNRWLNELGREQADKDSARAGYSEHQTGLAADIVKKGDEGLDRDFINTKAGKWLNDNCYKYGFIIRFPNGKESYTGYEYEPWHLRYVGTELAKELYNNGNWISLEEYLGIPCSYDIKPSTSSTSTTTTKKNYSVVAKHAIELRDTYYEFIGKANACITAGSCNYSIKGFSTGKSSTSQSVSVSNLKVRLMQSSRTGLKDGEPLPNVDLVDFEKYVLGVAYAEIGCPNNENYFKTQLVAARSFALSRPAAMGNSRGVKLSEENGQWILQIRSSVDDQQYCDPDLGCSYDPCGSNIERCQMWPGTTHGKVYMGPLTQDNRCRQWASETIGEVLVDKNGYIINTGYKQADQNIFKNSTNYKQTLMSHYSNANTIDKGNCNGGGDSTCAYGVSSGDFANWSQKCEECKNVHLGNSSATIFNAGCLATSVAMLIAKSGADTSQIAKDYGAFNNVTFVKALNKNGGFVRGNLQYAPITKVVPNFKYLYQHQFSGSRAQKIKTLQDEISQGHYVAIEVRNNCERKTHFVALDSIQGDHIYIMDPATNETETWTSTSTWKANCASKYVVFSKT